MSRKTRPRLEMDSATFGHGPAAGRWRWIVLAALVCTIPAFYIELIDDLPTPLAVAIYIGAALVVAYGVWLRAPHGRGRFAAIRAQWPDVLLSAGLVVAALLPPSAHSQLALTLRLAVALWTLGRMVLLMRRWLQHGSLSYLLGLAAGTFILAGLGFWVLEPRVGSVADGMWLAFTTAATVGYGDMVPRTPAGKIFAVFVVLLGYAVISLVTASIAAMWVEGTERRIERELLHELHAELKSVRAEIAELRRSVAAASPPGAPPHQPP